MNNVDNVRNQLLNELTKEEVFAIMQTAPTDIEGHIATKAATEVLHDVFKEAGLLGDMTVEGLALVGSFFDCGVIYAAQKLSQSQSQAQEKPQISFATELKQQLNKLGLDVDVFALDNGKVSEV